MTNPRVYDKVTDRSSRIDGGVPYGGMALAGREEIKSEVNRMQSGKQGKEANKADPPLPRGRFPRWEIQRRGSRRGGVDWRILPGIVVWLVLAAIWTLPAAGPSPPIVLAAVPDEPLPTPAVVATKIPPRRTPRYNPPPVATGTPLRPNQIPRLVSPSVPTPQIQLLNEGWSVHYDPQVMEQVVEVRQRGGVNVALPPFDPEAYEGYVARPDCNEVGQEVWLDFGQGWVGPFLVADCARVEDRPHIEARGIVVELGYPSAKRFGVARTGGLYVRVGQQVDSDLASRP